MSAILAIETSTALGSVAVVRGDEVLFENRFSSDRSHNSQLFDPLREALDVCGASLRAIIVGTGPASYTGVRIGIAAAQGVALSRQVPVIGLPSVLAAEVGVASYHVCGDARRGSYFVAKVSGGALIGEIAVLDAEGLRRRHAGSHRTDPWFTFDTAAPLGLQEVLCASPSAARLAAVAAALPRETLNSLSKAPLEPIYLSGPFVTMPRK